MKTSAILLLGTLTAGLAPRGLEAKITFQLDARKNLSTVTSSTETNLVWHTLQAMTVTGDASEWQDTGDGVENIASNPAWVRPLAFQDETTTAGKYVRSMVMVVRCTQKDGFRVKETLVGGERNFCLAGLPENLASNNVEGVFDTTEFYNQVASWRVDTIEYGVIEKGKTHLVEVTFLQDLPLASLVLGGQKGRREWAYGWGGQIMEVQGYDSVPSPDALAGLRHVLRLKWDLSADIPSATQSQHAAARALGTSLGFYVATLFLVR
jgi:hypothetical protein